MAFNKHDVVFQAGPKLYVVRVKYDGTTQVPEKIEEVAGDEAKAIQQEFKNGTMLGLPAQVGEETRPYRVDLNRLNDQVLQWERQRNPTAPFTNAGADSPDFNDLVLFVKNDTDDLWYIKVDGGEGAPLSVNAEAGPRKVTGYATTLAVRNHFNSGVMLGFLQQAPDPVGITCYMLNLAAFADYVNK